MSEFFNYIDHCPNVAGPLPDDVTEGDSDCELEWEALFISDSSTAVITASVEIITVPSSDDKPEDLEVSIPALSAAEQRYPRAPEMKEKVRRMMGGMNWMK